MQAWCLCVLTTTARAMMKISHENRREKNKVENVISISGRRDGEMSTARSCILCENPLRHRSHISSRLRPTESTVENEKKNSFSAPCVRSLEYFPFSSFY